jgi:hypothetical protein
VDRAEGEGGVEEGLAGEGAEFERMERITARMGRIKAKD